MSSLKPSEKAFLEELFDMSGGYVLNFSDATFGNFFGQYLAVDIHSDQYTKHGSSKAKKLREFWRLEPDLLVGKSISALIEHYEAALLLGNSEKDEKRQQLIGKCKVTANRLSSTAPHVHELKESVVVFNSDYLSKQIHRMEQSVYSDPSLAIGTAKELFETCCKTILHERSMSLGGKPDISTLSKAVFKELALVPDNVPDHAKGSAVIKRLLQNLNTIGQNLAELRGLYGTGHGKHGQTKGLAPRHAKLAVGSVATLVTFLFDTHNETLS